MAQPAKIPPQAGESVFEAKSDVNRAVPWGYFAEQEFPPTQLCEFCEATQAHDPAQQSRLAIGLADGKRICAYHKQLFETEPLAQARLP